MTIPPRRRRIIIELDLPANVDIPAWHTGLVPLLKRTIPTIVYIATEDVNAIDVIAGTRKK